MRTLALCLGLVLAGPVRADTVYLLTSSSETADYGLLIVAPETGCPAMRVLVEGAEGRWRSRTLGPGEVSIVRMGRGFPPGAHRLTLRAAGCTGLPWPARRVVLGKAGPDHGWRAEALR
ncbi:MAG: hypothetical protein KBF78_18405 [Fuscovulum sp.]|jgi:hypothetical protein|nr:hypothetical protein [Fuscovulum sp.]